MDQSNGGARPLQFVKILSWSLFAIIVGSSLVLSVFISKYAERTLLEKQEEFGRLLAENVSHQVFTRFAMPTILKYGNISLRRDDQFQLLDQVVRSTVHSFHVRTLRIYDGQGTIVYSLAKDEMGNKGNALKAVEETVRTEDFSAAIIAKVSKFASLLRFSLKPGSIILKAYYPVRAERSLTEQSENPIMGILEFEQDITQDFMSMLNFERLIIAFSLLTSLMLFIIIIVAIRRSERINMQRMEEKERLERELLQQEKLAGMGRMVAGVAHEIRNPLGIICSSSELVLKKARKENSSYTKLLEAVYDEGKRLSRTVGEFLDYARPKPPRMDDVDVRQVIEQLVVFLESECEKLGIELITDFQGDLHTRGDRDLLYRAFYNVVANGMQAMDGPGAIRILCSRVGDQVQVVIQDSGPGFDPEHLNQIRDPFFTTKENGTGLGMALVNTILESHNAKLDLSNAEEGGARVDILLPGQ